MREVTTANAPRPAGHYAQAIEHDGLVYVSGQIPIGPDRDVTTIGSIEVQTEQALVNLDAILRAAGSSRAQVLKVTVYVADMALWDRVNAVYAQFFGAHRPARTIVPTRELHYGFQVEVEAVAAVKSA